MATFNITNITAYSFQLEISDLQYDFSSYRYIKLLCYSGGKWEIIQLFTPVEGETLGNSPRFTYEYSTSGGIVTPGNTYKFKVSTMLKVNTDEWGIPTPDGETYEMTIAIPELEPDTYSLSVKNMGSLSETISRSDEYLENTVYCYKCSPMASGTMDFVVSVQPSASDMNIFLGTSSDFDATTGEPVDYLYFKNNFGNSSISCDVEEGQTYYFWVNVLSDNWNNIEVILSPPLYEPPPPPLESWDVEYSELGVVSEQYSSDRFYLWTRTAYCYSVSFQKSGMATFYSTNTLYDYMPLSGHLASSDVWDESSQSPVDILDVTYKDHDDVFKFTYNVEQNKTYYVWILCYGDVVGEKYNRAKLIIEPPVTTATLWDWTENDARKKAKAAIDGQGYLSDFSYTVWNDLVNKTQTAINSEGGEWLTSNNEGTKSYLTYGDTLMTSEDKNMTAARFNALRFNIGSRSSTGIQDQNKGDIIYGWYFVRFANSLNAWLSEDYITYPLNASDRPSYNPAVEKNVGGYYYKYSYSDTSKAASTDVDLSDVVMKPQNGDYKNNGYIFLACLGTASSPPEFGIYTAPAMNGVWKCYTREAGSGVIVPHKEIFEPTSSEGGVYKYDTSDKITIRVRLSGNDIIGQIEKNGVIIAEHEVSGAGTGIGENTKSNTFLLGASFVPDGYETTVKRGTYLQHVRLSDGYLYENNKYGGKTIPWVPDVDNEATYYAIVVQPRYAEYNRVGKQDEEINISYE